MIESKYKFPRTEGEAFKTPEYANPFEGPDRSRSMMSRLAMPVGAWLAVSLIAACASALKGAV